MIRGFILSILLHVVLFAFMWVDMADLLFPQKPVKAIQVRLVMAKNVKKANKKIEKVKTQQSAAPKEAPKPKEKKKKKPKPKKDIPTIVAKDKLNKAPKKQINKPKKKKVEPPKQEEKPEPKKEPRPPKLDKTKDKKNIIQDSDPKAKPVAEPKDFMDALSFIESLKAEKEAMFEGEETDPTTINLSDQADIAVVRRHIERNWYKTPGTAGEHTIHIRISITRDGSLKAMEIIESSGSRSFDKSLERAVRKSVPLPIPPEKYELFETIDLHFTDAS